VVESLGPAVDMSDITFKEFMFLIAAGAVCMPLVLALIFAVLYLLFLGM